MLSIDLQGIRKVFPRANGGSPLVVFNKLSLEVGAGEVVGVVGPSGCGKSTLLNLVALLEPPDDGAVVMGGRALTLAEVGSLSMGYLFQRDALLPWRSAWRNALLGVECRGGLRSGVEERTAWYFKQFGLAGFEHAMPHTLSGGQRQRVALIQNLLVDPDVLLLDEPFGNLDYQTKLTLEEELNGIIRPAAAGKGETIPAKTVLFVTHDIEEAIVLADRVVVLGPPPAGILADIRVPIPPAMRSPVAARQSEVARRLFSEIWALLKTPQTGTRQSGLGSDAITSIAWKA